MVSVLPPHPPAKGLLDRYRLLSPTASVRVSPLCLGGMNFGNAWTGFMGSCDQETTEGILDYFHGQGGNFIDTSNNYQNQESEAWIGEWMKKRGVRDQMVIATKYTTSFRLGHQGEEIMINSQGNGSKSLHLSVNASLKKLQTDYIDLLYIHWWDFGTSIPEVMQSLNHLVASGKVLYLGISDTPAWIVSKANEYARNHNLRPFSIYQGRWSAAYRDFERDILPMCRDENMALAPWGALGSGKFKTAEQFASNEVSRSSQPSENDIKISAALEAVAKRKDTIITSVAQAYVMAKAPYVFPIIGGRTIEHLKGNIDALKLRLSTEDIKEIEAAIPFDVGFPYSFTFGGPPDHFQDTWLLKVGGTIDHVPQPKSISRD